MTFGLRNAAQTFQRFIDEITQDLNIVFPYINDLIVASQNKDEHLQHLKILFQRLRDYELVMNFPKCQIAQSEVKLLGHLIHKDGFNPLLDKVDAILKMEPPKTVKSLRGFLGTVNFYRKFINNVAEILSPLNQVLEGPNVKGSHPVHGTFDLQYVFDAAK